MKTLLSIVCFCVLTIGSGQALAEEQDMPDLIKLAGISNANLYESLTEPSTGASNSVSDSLRHTYGESTPEQPGRGFYDFLFGSASYSGSSAEITRGGTTVFTEMDYESGTFFALRGGRWFKHGGGAGLAGEFSFLSASGSDSAGSTLDAGVMMFAGIWMVGDSYFKTEKIPDGRFSLHGGIGLFMYSAYMDASVPGVFSDQVNATDTGISMPLLLAGLRWNMSQTGSLLIEARYIPLNLSGTNEDDYIVWVDEHISTELDATVISIGISKRFD